MDELGERLLDANRTIGQPRKLANIDGSIKQYVRDHLLLRTEATSNNVRDFGVPKTVDAVPQLRTAMAAVTDRYQSVQQDILET